MRTLSPARPRHAGRRAPRFPLRAGALVLAIAVLAGCGGSAADPAGSPSGTAAYPVTVVSCGVPVSYDRAPRRAVSNDINTT